MSKTVKGVRLVAVLEAAKGMIVFLAGFGMLSFIHEYHRDPVAVLIKHFHINHNHYPRIFLEVADSLADIRLWALAALAASDTIMRLIEAYGLWNGRRWAEWFAGEWRNLHALRNLRAYGRHILAQDFSAGHQYHYCCLSGPCPVEIKTRPGTPQLEPSPQIIPAAPIFPATPLIPVRKK